MVYILCGLWLFSEESRILDGREGEPQCVYLLNAKCYEYEAEHIWASDRGLKGLKGLQIDSCRVWCRQQEMGGEDEKQ